MALFPTVRLRRLRENPVVRDLVREVRVHPSSLVMPMFIKAGKKDRRPIAAMPGIFQFSPDEALKECEALVKSGIRSVLLFGIPETKDAVASSG
ncbi:MAG TPA: porphobilinogen synthase, partial [bacterium]|nr:porphobilinogen synthase [bacterium]